MIAYDKNGDVFALTDGAELLVHDGESEGPLWRKMLDSRIVALGASSEHIVAITESGVVSWFGAMTGDMGRTARIDGSVRAASIDIAGDRIAALTDRAIVRLAGDQPQQLADHAAEAIAISPDGTVIAATASELLMFAADGKRSARSLAGIRALAHHPEGFWVIGFAAKLMKWTGDGEPTHITNLPPSSQLERLACSDKAIGVAWNRNMVVALEWPSKETLGSLQYIENTVEGIDFGPWPWLGVSINKGDGNKFNLVAGNLHRSDTHPGREHHSWMVSVGGGAQAEAPRAPRTTPAASKGMPLGVLLALVAVALVIFFAVR